MPLKNTKTQYGYISKFIHGLLALIIILQLIGGALNDVIPRSIKGTFFIFHKSFGIVILFLMLLFILWRWVNVKPAWPAEMNKWERFLARWTHRLLYLGFLVMPLSGWLMSTAAGKAPNFFWLGAFPFPFIAANRQLETVMMATHYYAAWLVSVLIVLHVLGALKHHCCDKNNILRRMFW